MRRNIAPAKSRHAMIIRIRLSRAWWVDVPYGRDGKPQVRVEQAVGAIVLACPVPGSFNPYSLLDRPDFSRPRANEACWVSLG